MKKTLMKLACILLVSLLTVIPVLAVDAGVSYGNVAKAPVAIVLDGEKDAAYDYALVLHQSRKHFEAEPDTATVGDTYLLWADGFIYVFADITDATLIPTTEDIESNTPWMADSMEVFLDVGNDGVDSMQYRIDFQGRPSFQFTDKNSYAADASVCNGIFEYAEKTTAKGYSVEFKIPHASGKVGEKVGLQLQINDMADAATRTCVFPPNSLGGGSWDVTLYDYIVLADAPVIETTAAPAAEAAPTDTAATAAPQTSDAGIAALIMLISAAAVITFISKKRG